MIQMAITNDSGTVTITVEGRLDASTAPQLEKTLKGSLSSAHDVVLDFSNLKYISSAGIRTLLSIEKKLRNKGTVTVKNATPQVREIMECVGVDYFLKMD